MSELNEEILMAYADGELDPQVMAQVEAALANEPRAQEKVRRYQRVAQLSRQAFDEPMHSDVPSRLLRAAGATLESGGEVVSTSTRSAQRSGWSIRKLALPLAASLALVIGAAVGYQMHSSLESAQTAGTMAALTGQIDSTIELHHMLESAKSGMAVVWTQRADGIKGRAIVQLTFKAADGRYCRQYQLRLSGPDAPQATTGVACRSKEGRWRSEIAFSSRSDGGEAGDEAYVAASGGGYQALDLFLDQVMIEPAFDAETESRVIEAKWQ